MFHSMMNSVSTGVCFLALCVSASAFGQNNEGDAKDGEYQPRVGEPIEYGKKYYPTEPRSEMFLEVNPFLLINRGLGFEFETRLSDRLSFGSDFIYRKNSGVYDNRNGTTASTQYLGFAPKLRIYPIEPMSGVFFGFKLYVGQVLSEVTVSNNSTSDSEFQVAPAVHAGYRLTTFGGFTVAGYLGGGINIPRAKFDKTLTGPDVEAARDRLDSENEVFRPDFGVTFGIAM